jgi:hypothetical protein
VQLALEHFAQRLGVHHAFRRRERRFSARQQTASPAERAPPQVARIDVEHIVDAEVAPHLGQLVDLLWIRFLPRRKERRIDAARRHARQDVGYRFRKFPGENSQDADLIRATCTTAAEDERKTQGLVGHDVPAC